MHNDRARRPGRPIRALRDTAVATAAMAQGAAPGLRTEAPQPRRQGGPPALAAASRPVRTPEVSGPSVIRQSSRPTLPFLAHTDAKAY